MKTFPTYIYRNAKISNNFRLRDRFRCFGAPPVSLTLQRTLLLLVLMFVGLTSSATLIKDEEGNYIIATKADFIELTTKNSYWANHQSFTQIADIDLDGEIITPIGNTSKPFTGVYEGNGHTLKNAVMYWNNATCFQYGIFGYICGTLNKDEYACVRNLNIENMRITRLQGTAINNMYTSTGDLKIGILAGQAGEQVKLHDICLRNCQITDNDIDATVKAVIVGGLIGDIYKNSGASTDPMTATGLTIRNIYSQVDIKLDKTLRHDNDQQFFVGGIIGRMRYPTLISQMPDNTVFSGTIKAPRASISPTVANMRGDSDNKYNTLVKNYAGELTSTPLKNALGTPSAFEQFQKTRLYVDYRIYNSTNSTVEKITNEYPITDPKDGTYAYGTRTLSPNADTKGTVYTSGWSNNSDDKWPRVQGVNWGVYADPTGVEADRTRILDMLSDGRTETNTCHWEWDMSHNTCKLVNDNDIKFLKVYIENDADNNVYRAKLAYKDASIAYPGTIDGSIQWYSATSIQNDDWAPVSGATSMTIPANKSLFFRVEISYNGYTLKSDYIAPFRKIYVYNPESNKKYNSAFADEVHKFNKDNEECYRKAGSDSNTGLSPEEAVLTMAKAYELLDEYGSVTTNSIVVMGYYTDDAYLTDPNVTVLQYNKPATITGTDNDQITDGVLGFVKLNNHNSATGTSSSYLFMQAPIRLSNIMVLNNWQVTGNSVTTKATNGCFIICNFFDFTVDENVSFANYKNPSTSTNIGLPANIMSLPFITVVGGYEDCNKDARVDPIKYADELYADHPGFYSTKGVTTITIRSGVFARIICCCRNNQLNTISRNITGSPDIPNRVRLNVNIKDDIDMTDPDREKSKYGYDLELVKGKIRYVSANYSHNIGLIAGGQTDGSAYGDVIMNIYSGHIGRIITSNITYGRPTDVTDKNNNITAYYPCDSFWGRSILNIYGNTQTDANGTFSSETTINEVFGGILGRLDIANAECRPYFYGKSVINMYGGYIGAYTGSRDDSRLDELKKTNANLYGVGSGGVTGLGYDDHHTTDITIPYINAQGNLVYGKYEDFKPQGLHMPIMKMHDGEEISLEVAKCEVNLYSGVVMGSVYGGGYGYSSALEKKDGAWIYPKAPDDLGVLYGDSKVTMFRHPDFQPPMVLGNIYGSGRGSSFYADNMPEADPDETRERFRAVAAQYGNTEVIISEGTVGNAMTGTGGDVYAGSEGVKGYDDIAALYGSTSLVVDGGTIYGNIYGGSEIANIHSHPSIPNSGNTHVTINGGTIGNNIFGGSKGIVGATSQDDAKAIIYGNTYVNINGGDFLGCPYKDLRNYIDKSQPKPTGIDIVNNRDEYRTFNIYGGGYMNCDIYGEANLNITSSLLRYEESFVVPEENPNAMDDPTIDDETTFHKNYMDITYRNFCVYGGGFGEKTNVLNTNVYVTIPHDRPNVSLPHGYTLQRFLDHQSFFDVAGGGYSGDVGHWATAKTPSADEAAFGIKPETPVKNIDIQKYQDFIKNRHSEYEVEDGKFDQNKVYRHVRDLYDHYVGGACNVTIDDYTFTRKIIGGGFYGSCRTTNTHVRCGSLRQIYGGSLLGYVHDRAYLQFGNRIEDFVLWRIDPDLPTGGEYIYSETADATAKEEPEKYKTFRGDFDNLKNCYSEVYHRAAAFAKELNDNIFITENIYGGNDVKGIIGTKFWEAPESTKEEPIYGMDMTDGAPLFCTDIDPSEEKGIVFNIYGGTFIGDVYSAGNGHYRGYFVPEWVRYDDGPVRMYRNVISSKDATKKAKAYRSRPMVGSVNVNLRGNSENDYIKLRKNFFGGGRECTIGEFNTILPLEDPRRLVAGGHLHVNIGGYTHIDGNVYLGAEGELYSQQQCIPSVSSGSNDPNGSDPNGSDPNGSNDPNDPNSSNDPNDPNRLNVPKINLNTFDGSTTKELAKLGNAAYDHWYYDSEKECYLPGYPAPGKVDGNFGMTGEHMLSSYMQNVQVQGDVEITFYRFLYERDENDCYIYRTFADKSQNRIRKHWLPGELAIDEYDASDVVMNSFFLGGLSGSMTNNNVMQHTYPATATSEEKKEKWGCIYRITLPRGVTVQDKVVMGSENATIHVYPYNEDYTDVIKTKIVVNPETEEEEEIDIDPIYTYEGGIITQHTFSFDLIAYNDKNSESRHYVPDDFYTNSIYEELRTSDHYTLTQGPYKGRTIHRYNYPKDVNPSLSPMVDGNKRYSMALIDMVDDNGNTQMDGKGNPLRQAYIGPRDFRTPSYEGAGENDFAVVSKLTLACKFSQLVDPTASDPEDHRFHYGGNVYGGCYNSGLVIGDVVLNIGSNLLGEHLDQTMSETFNEFSSLKYNLGRVFGGGFGKDTRIEGDTYVNLLLNFKGMNVFGGGMMGDVTGSSHISYIGTEDSYIFGSIYGGGLQGYVGTKDQTIQATTVRLFSGNVEKVYGGSCMGDLHGRAFVEVCDKVTTELDHLDYDRLNFDKWGTSRLIAGKVFGGNDIAGNINPPNSIPYTLDYDPIPGTPWEDLSEDDVYKRFAHFSTGVYVHEVRDDKGLKNSPGTINGYNGFPLIGDLYGGSNGNYGVQEGDYYRSGKVTLALGKGCDTKDIDLTGMDVPHIDKSHLLIRGGSIINAYGGGDMSDIQSVNKITIDYPNQEAYTKARAGFKTDKELQRVWTVLNFSSDQQKDEVTYKDPEGHSIFLYQICRLFGGNNNSDMAIQPTWVLNSGNIGSLYSGGNFGKMTFYQPYREAKPAQPAVEADPTADPPIEAKEAVPAVQEQQELGLTLTVDSYDLTIENVYGGGRLGDIDPDLKKDENGVPTLTPSESFYGATLNIRRGIINHVYGGNDVSGYINFGTNVNLNGAISGDVYCAGNGNYLYQYDRQGNMYEYDDYFVNGQLDRTHLKIEEDFAFRTAEYTGARYFKLPAKTEYGLKEGLKYQATDAQVIMAINSYRPHVQRARLHIAGTPENKVWVRGNVYCGGNSASVIRKKGSKEYEVTFDIGSHVILNGVFLGSNGSSLAMGDMIMYTERLNAENITSNETGTTISIPLNMVGKNNLELSDLEDATDHSVVLYKPTLYPSILDLYMRAVESTEKPRDFDFDPDIEDSYIGDFCVGGNRGSMMTDKCITLNFPATLTLFGSLIGGCKDANVTYNGVTHIGGLNMPLDPAQIASGNKAKVDLKIRSMFRPLSLLFPDVNATPQISINNTIVGSDGKKWTTGNKYYADKQCNVYGGCFTSGTTVGNIKIDLYSDMLNYECYDDTQANYIDKQAVINGIKDARSWRSFTVVGGGYGDKTAVYGDIDVRMLPEKITKKVVKDADNDGDGDANGEDENDSEDNEDNNNEDGDEDSETYTVITHPSAASIFGGSQEGLIVGNTNVEIRDGKILANVYGASEASKMYGSTSVIVGYPKYYRAIHTGNYRLNRADYMSNTARYDYRDEFDEVVIPKTIAYFKGDIVPDNIYQIINGRVKNARINNVIGADNFRVGKTVDDGYVDKIIFDNTKPYSPYVDDTLERGENDTPRTHFIGDFFEAVESNVLDDEDNPIADHIIPADFGVTWDDITIWIGDQQSNTDTSKPFYGQGNVYGGGYVPSTADRSLIGKPTVMRYTKDYNRGVVEEFAESENRDAAIALYGGNTAVMIWDDLRAAEINPSTGEYKYTQGVIYADGEIKDHIHIGSGYFKEVTLPKGASVKGYFKKYEKKITSDSDNAAGTEDSDNASGEGDSNNSGDPVDSGNPNNSSKVRSLDGSEDSDNSGDSNGSNDNGSSNGSVDSNTSESPAVEEAYIYLTIGKADGTTKYYEKVADGGVYGGGRKVFAEAFRSIDLAYYGYADHTPQKPKLLNTIQRADIATITDCCMELVGASDFTVNDFEGTYYAINRVGELRMFSSIPPNFSLDKGYTLSEEYPELKNEDGIRIHAKKRSRNYIALYNKTNHLGAFRSNWTLEQKYHLENGLVTSLEEPDQNYGYPKDKMESYVNHKHKFIDLYNAYLTLKAKADDTTLSPSEALTVADVEGLIDLYNAFPHKSSDFTKEEADQSNPIVPQVYLEKIGECIRDDFHKRNVGTSGNMIGISSGYELRIEGLSRKFKADNITPEDQENMYYGPAYGVTELKLLTTVSGIGGGFVYALNHHFDPAVDNYSDGKETPGWCSKFGAQDFLQTTGNFVFPGAAYNTSQTGKNYNYIIDDCYDPDDMSHGYYQCNHTASVGNTSLSRSRRTYDAGDSGSGNDSDNNGEGEGENDEENDENSGDSGNSSGSTRNINDLHEVHYWYVSGNTYMYNVTLTAITSDEDDKDKDFFLRNDNERISLFNVKPGTEIEVKEVSWFEHVPDDVPEGFSCDLTNTDLKYKLYLSLSSDPKNLLQEDSNNKKGAYVIRVPRLPYEADVDQYNKIVNRYQVEDPDKDFYDYYDGEDKGVIVDPNYYLNADVNNNRFGYNGNTVVSDIKPLLGLHLVDREKNRKADLGKEESLDYFDKHLKPDHMLQVKLETKIPSETSTPENPDYSESIFYIINIDIKYLLGPAVYGDINIENCALPGEYIYVNAHDIEVVMDENLIVDDQKWRLYPNDDTGNRLDQAHYAISDLKFVPDSEGNLYYDLSQAEFAEGEIEDSQFVVKDKSYVHIPAFYYQNGWEPVFTLKANEKDFECKLPFNKQVYDEDEQEWVDVLTRLHIHNYHRMKPIYEGVKTDKVKNHLYESRNERNVIDLRLVKGARIYLENEEDMDYFFEYLDIMQNETVPTGFTRLTITDKTDPENIKTVTTNPQFCTDLDFYQQKNLTVPTKSEFTPKSKKLNFEGNYHGNGNWMIIPSEASIYMVNSGNLYNTGFVSEVSTESTIIYNENYGKIYNSFYFNKAGKGALAKNGQLFNCYQNTPLITMDQDPDAVEFKYNQLLKLSTQGFRYGQAAYNLNGFYLQKRHKLLHEPYLIKGVLQDRPNNDPYSLHERDFAIRGDEDIDYDRYLTDYSVDYIEKMFNNGDYRYAFYNLAVGNNVYTQFTEALRTAEEPNYFDHKSYHGTSEKVSMHDYTHKIDYQRWCDVHQLYHPIFDKDFMFFGEDLSVDIEHAEEHNYLPEAYHPENRVYRVGGFYGSAADKGYFMNRNAYLDTPLITAVDFVGYRDQDMYKSDGTLKDNDIEYGYNYKGDIEDDGWVIRKGWHEVFMPPTLDLPWTLDADDKPRHDFSNFRVNSDKVTHNLLIYTEDLEEANTVMQQFHYNPDLTYGQTDEYSFATHSDQDIFAHHIIDSGEGPTMSEDGYFHLVDKHDFNAPVEFKAKRAWYNRMPQDYCTEFIRTNANNEEEIYKDGWEGICLPFDVGKVYAASTDKTNMRDMGEITHFSGEHWKGHEYWLRRLAISSNVRGQLCFERPTVDNLRLDANGDPNPEIVGDYEYTNTTIYDLYKDFHYDVSNVTIKVDGKDYTHDLLYHDRKEPVIKDYRYMSRSIPYIVTYPGRDFYEFDLSGNFYADQIEKYYNGLRPKPVPQTICYVAKEDTDDPAHVTIPITDNVPLISYTQGGYSMKGTFVHVTDNEALSQSVLYTKVDNLAVLDAIDLSGKEVHHGWEFKVHSGDMVVEPFRTYLVDNSSSSSSIIIGSRSITDDHQVWEEQEPEVLPDTIDAEQEGIKVWVEGQKLVIQTPYDLTTTIFDMSGRPVRHIKAYEGTNRYSGLDQGFYIVLRTKFAIL